MIHFTHQGAPVALPLGETWCLPPLGGTYRDTPVTELTEIIRDVSAGQPWRDAVRTRYAQKNPWLHRIVTSSSRDLFFRLHPPAHGSRILDIGAGWGQLSLSLAHMGAEVTALEPTPERLDFIKTAALQEGIADKCHFLQTDFFRIEFETRFDLALCIGVLEWVPKFREGNPRELQIDFLRRIRQLLNPGAKLVVGIENRVGLKYLLGAPDDHIALPYITVFDQPLATRKMAEKHGQNLRCFTLSRSEISEFLQAAGFTAVEYYAALPDYKLPEVIIPLGPLVDEYFQQSHHIPEHSGSNGALLPFQEELRSHYKTFSHLGVSSQFVPSFFCVATA